MTRLLDEAVATVSTLPEEVQDDVARIMLQLAGIEQPPYVLTPEEEADLDASIAEADRGEFATEEEIGAIRAKYGR
jgi:predicted transcriptional regulator